jgi:outer membrane protein OmpA-like peptidoglycan-associated protein
MDCYIDQHHLMAMDDCGVTPTGISLGCWQPVGYRNVRIATGAQVNAFSPILTKNKLITHSINFAVNKSDIEPESVHIIMQLAQFLRANPSVSLSINGHTDSDGDKAANIKLSKERADEVKKQLVAQGIAAERLSTQGYGANKPIRPNTTAAGKAENRRVELVRR